MACDLFTWHVIIHVHFMLKLACHIALVVDAALILHTWKMCAIIHRNMQWCELILSAIDKHIFVIIREYISQVL